MNPRQNIAGKGKVIIRAFSNSEINGKTYLANEPIVILDNVFVQVNYDNDQKVASNKFNKMATNEIKPDNIVINPEAFSPSLYRLMGVEIEKTYNKTISGQMSSDGNGVIYLSHSNDVVESLIFVYDAARNLVNGHTYDSTLSSINGLDINTEYYIVYSVSKSSDKAYTLKTTNMPYLRVEIEVYDNSKATPMIIIVERASFSISPQITIDSETILMPALIFTLIDNEVNIYY